MGPQHFASFHPGRDFQAHRIEADEAGGVVLVVGPALAGWVGFHRGDGRGGEAHGGFAVAAHDVALVELHAHGAGDVFWLFVTSACNASCSGANQ